VADQLLTTDSPAAARLPRDGATLGALAALSLAYLRTANARVVAAVAPPTSLGLALAQSPKQSLVRGLALVLIRGEADLGAPTEALLNSLWPASLRALEERGQDKRAVAAAVAAGGGVWGVPGADENGVDSASLLFNRLASRAGAALGLAMLYAGSRHAGLVQLLHDELAASTRALLRPPAYLTAPDRLAHRRVSLTTTVNYAIALSLVLAGTGNLAALRVLRALRVHLSSVSTTTFGDHGALATAFGLLFAAGGTATVGRSAACIGPLLISLWPLYPLSAADDAALPQAVRHFTTMAFVDRLVTAEQEGHDGDDDETSQGDEADDETVAGGSAESGARGEGDGASGVVGRRCLRVPLVVTLEEGRVHRIVTPSLLPSTGGKIVSVTSASSKWIVAGTADEGRIIVRRGAGWEVEEAGLAPSWALRALPTSLAVTPAVAASLHRAGASPHPGCLEVTAAAIAALALSETPGAFPSPTTAASLRISLESLLRLGGPTVGPLSGQLAILTERAVAVLVAAEQSQSAVSTASPAVRGAAAFLGIPVPHDATWSSDEHVASSPVLPRSVALIARDCRQALQA